MPGFLEYNLGAQLQRAEIVALSDVHAGDPYFVESEFLSLLKWVMDEPNRFVILNGDLANIAIKTGKSDAYAATMTPDEEVYYLVDRLRPLAKGQRVLVSTSGNHEERITKNDSLDPAKTIAKFLEVPYFREGVVLFIRLGRSARRTGRHDAEPVPYLFYVTHGSAGGRKGGASLNRMEDSSLNVEGVDVVVVGHTHHPIASKNMTIVPDVHNKKLIERERAYVNAGAFMRWGGYAEAKQYTPGSRSMPVVELDGTVKRVTLRI